jgi:hypothetical protein
MADEIEVLRTFRDEMPGPSTDAWIRARAAIAVARAEEGPRRPRRGPGPRRRLWIAGGVGVAAAVAGLVAVLIPGAPGAGLSGQQIKETAYVVTHVERALGSTGQDNVIGYTRTQFPAGSILEPEAFGQHSQSGLSSSSPWSVGWSVRWSYRDTMKTSAFSPTGQRVFDELTTVDGKPTAFAVIYGDKTWWRGTLRPAQAPRQPAPSGCGPAVIIGPGGWSAFIRSELTCGEYLIDGRQWLDGIDAIKMTGNKGLDAMWVNPATYLPLRVIFTFGRERIQTEFRWLRPTPASLAQLGLTVPAGFRQVPPPS